RLTPSPARRSSDLRTLRLEGESAHAPGHAASHAHDESGGAGLLGWTLADRGLGISFWGQAMSAHYVHASLGLQDERALIDGGASLAVPLGEYGSATLRTSVRDLRDAGTENRNEAHLHWRLGGQTTLTTSATHVTG